jgi:hypothetical protein
MTRTTMTSTRVKPTRSLRAFLSAPGRTTGADFASVPASLFLDNSLKSGWSTPRLLEGTLFRSTFDPPISDRRSGVRRPTGSVPPPWKILSLHCCCSCYQNSFPFLLSKSVQAPQRYHYTIHAPARTLTAIKYMPPRRPCQIFQPDKFFSRIH